MSFFFFLEINKVEAGGLQSHHNKKMREEEKQKRNVVTDKSIFRCPELDAQKKQVDTMPLSVHPVPEKVQKLYRVIGIKIEYVDEQHKEKYQFSKDIEDERLWYDHKQCILYVTKSREMEQKRYNEETYDATMLASLGNIWIKEVIFSDLAQWKEELVHLLNVLKKKENQMSTENDEFSSLITVVDFFNASFIHTHQGIFSAEKLIHYVENIKQMFGNIFYKYYSNYYVRTDLEMISPEISKYMSNLEKISRQKNDEILEQDKYVTLINQSPMPIQEHRFMKPKVKNKKNILSKF